MNTKDFTKYEVASHADLSDEGQTVHVAVEVGTQAADAADGDQVIDCLLYTSRCV